MKDEDRLWIALKEWIEKEDLGKVIFYSREDWEERGEQFGNTADLSMNIESSDLYYALNYSSDSKYYYQLNEIAYRFGYHYELGFAWSLHFYKD